MAEWEVGVWEVVYFREYTEMSTFGIDSSEKCARIKKRRILDTRDLSKVDKTAGSRFIFLALFVYVKGEEWICLMLLLLAQE